MSPPQRRQKPLFPRGAQSATKSPPARAGDKAPRGERRGRTERSEAGKGEPPPPTRSPGAAQGKASEDAPQRAEPRPGKGRGDQRGQSTAAERKGARRAHGLTLAQSEERRPRREGQGEPDKGRRRNEPHPGERRIPLMPCSRHRAAQGAGRKGALPPKRTDECAPGSRTSPQNDAEQQHGPGVATVAAVLGRRCSPRTAAALAACAVR